MIELARIAEIINTNFCEPSLPKNHVRARMRDDGSMDLFIGRRDVHISTDGKVRGAGTSLCETPDEDREEVC